MAGIEFRKVSKRFGQSSQANKAANAWVVQDISFTVGKGTLTTILGPSGCGKTTTLRLIAGLESVSSGDIFIDGQNVTALGPSERNVSMVFQSYALFPHMNVLTNVRYGLDVSGVNKEEAQSRAMDALASVGLTNFANRLPSELSGGQQQRVAVARALVLQPSVLLFDEPLSNLDARLRRTMRNEIRQLQQRFGLTVAYVTHDQNEALAVSDQIIVMESGHIAQNGTPEELYEYPATAFVASCMGEALLLEGNADASGQVHFGNIVCTPRQNVSSGAIRATIRPEAWIIGTPGDDAWNGQVIQRTYLGNIIELTVATPEQQVPQVLVIISTQAPSPALNEQIGLRLKGNGVSVVKA